MSGTRTLVFGSVACTLAFAVAASGQNAPAGSVAPAPSAPHTIIVSLIERPGAPKPYGFEPATFTAQRGDTLRFVQAASTLHNVHFKTQPKGAKLGSAAMSQYLTTKGQSYVLVVDSRFTDGTYEIVCDPHETIGMHAFLTVKSGTAGSGQE
jgi:plastocyanin